MATPVTPPAADSTPPTVALTAPAAGATISGSVNVTADASDNVGVAGVQYLLDGAALGAEDTAAPYSVTWSTLAATNGGHTLAARARDAAGNVTTSAARTVTVANATATGLVAAYAFDEGAGTTTADAAPSAVPTTVTSMDYLGGTIDEVRVYERALLQAEVQADMTTPISALP